MYDVLMYSCGFVCLFYVSPTIMYMVRCNDIRLAKRLQYALLSLVGPPSTSRIGSYIGRDKLVSEPRPTLGAPLDRSCSLAIIESRRTLFLESSYIEE